MCRRLLHLLYLAAADFNADVRDDLAVVNPKATTSRFSLGRRAVCSARR
jgi:hypothetical protein